MNFEIVNRTSTAGHIVPFATGTSRTAAGLSFPGTVTTSASATVALGADSNAGKMDVYLAGGPVDLLVNVVGYYTAVPTADDGETPSFFTAGTARLLDKYTLAGNSTVEIAVAGQSGVPAENVVAVALNIQVRQTSTTGGGHIGAWADDESNPGTSVLNYQPAGARSNFATVAVGANGGIRVYNGGSAAVTLYVDLQGWYAAFHEFCSTEAEAASADCFFGAIDGSDDEMSDDEFMQDMIVSNVESGTQSTIDPFLNQSVALGSISPDAARQYRLFASDYAQTRTDVYDPEPNGSDPSPTGGTPGGTTPDGHDDDSPINGTAHRDTALIEYAVFDSRGRKRKISQTDATYWQYLNVSASRPGRKALTIWLDQRNGKATYYSNGKCRIRQDLRLRTDLIRDRWNNECAYPDLDGKNYWEIFSVYTNYYGSHNNTYHNEFLIDVNPEGKTYGPRTYTHRGGSWTNRDSSRGELPYWR